MGTKLQYSVNLVTASPKDNYDAITTSDSWDFFNKRLLTEKARMAGLEKLQDSMDKLLEQCNRETVRKTMMIHEETFKEQVRELHRLYRVQKMLMAELRNKVPKLEPLVKPIPQAIQARPNLVDMDNRTGFWSPGTSQTTFSNWHHPITQTNSGYNIHQLYSIRADPSLQEQSSSCSGDTFRMPRGFDLEQPAEEDISTDVSVIEDQAGPSSQRPLKDKMIIDGSHDPQFCTDEENEVELTLSIGYGSSKKKLKNHQPHPNLKFGCSESTHNETWQPDPSMTNRSDGVDKCSEPNNTMGSVSATFDQESKQRPPPPWHFQSLSLNRT